MNRRSFGKYLLASAIVPAAQIELREQVQEKVEVPVAPQSIAGYAMSDEDKELVVRFLAEHEAHMAPLRQLDLPNGLSPNLVFAAIVIRKSSREATDG